MAAVLAEPSTVQHGRRNNPDRRFENSFDTIRLRFHAGIPQLLNKIGDYSRTSYRQFPTTVHIVHRDRIPVNIDQLVAQAYSMEQNGHRLPFKVAALSESMHQQSLHNWREETQALIPEDRSGSVDGDTLVVKCILMTLNRHRHRLRHQHRHHRHDQDGPHQQIHREARDGGHSAQHPPPARPHERLDCRFYFVL